MLTPFQEAVLRILAVLPEARGFALAGGAAVITRGIVDRGTNDLDLFGAAAPAVHRLAGALTAALEAEDLDVSPIIDKPGFVRLVVLRGTDQTTVDLATDARMRDAEDTPWGQVLSTEELAADKLLALFSRAQARDFVDVAALSDVVGGLDRICELAAEKDAGFDREVLAEMLGGFDRLRKDDFPLTTAKYQHLRNTVRSWREELTK